MNDNNKQHCSRYRIAVFIISNASFGWIA